MSRLKLNKQIITVQAVLVMLFTVGVIQAQDAVTRWDLNNCISYALEKNLTVNKARLDILSGEADLMQARGQRLPNLSGSVSQTLSGGDSPWEMNYSGSLSVTSAVTLYNGGLINNDIERSVKAQELDKLNLEQASNSIILSVTQAYLNALYAKENIDYYTQVLTSSKRQVERATALKKAGTLAYRDVADIEAQFASDRYALVNASNELVLRITTLKQILEIPVEDSFELYFPEEGVKESLDPLPTRADAFESALNIRPEVKGSQLQQEMAQIDLKSARANYLPTLGLNASVATDYTDMLSTGYGTQMSDKLNERIGLTLSVPIFNRFATKANVSRSQIKLESASLSLINTRNKLLQEVEKAYEDTRASQEQFEAALAQERASAESYRLAEEQYNIGMLDVFELLQIKSKYLNASRELIQTRYTTVLYRKILDFYMGVPISLEN